MKNILISSFGTSHDFLSLAELASSLKVQYQNVNIEVVTQNVYKKDATLLRNIDRFHYIDIDKMNQIFSNPLYSDAFAINYYADIQNDISDVNWDRVINHTNDDISSFFLATFQDTTLAGTYINQQGLPKMTSRWAIYQNYVASRQSRMTIDKITLRNHIAQTPYVTDAQKIYENEEYSVMASQNFNRIKQIKGSLDTKIIGINLEEGYDQYLFDDNSLRQLIETLEDSEEFKPVLLLNGKEYQKEIVNRLNADFNNSLISINMDTEALPSVIGNLDFLITTSNDQMAVADMMNKEVLVVREFCDKFTTQIHSENNYMIRVKDEKTLGNDILLVINELFETSLPIETMNSSNPVYKVIADQFSTFFSQIRGDIDIKKEINYHLERSYFFELLGYDRNTHLLDHIRDNTDIDTIQNYTNEVKAELTSTVKVLLATLRSLKSIKQSQDGLNQFIGYLDTLIMSGASQTCVGNIIKFFEGEIENIDSPSVDENISKIEAKLFELKGNLQIFTQYLEQITTNTMSKRFEAEKNI